MLERSTPSRGGSSHLPVLITGGAGFIGSNLAHRLLSAGREVILFDNLSRAGVEHNARWLREEFGNRVELIVGDTRDDKAVTDVVKRASAVFHFAAQVAVTTSLVHPIVDFDVNLRGTLTILEALRALKSRPPLLFTSTNKVYGNLSEVALRETGVRYEPTDPDVQRRGISERHPLDFHSPYGCSKGASDQYVLDYARSYGVPATVFRMSCIYGPRQFGTEDQGWVAHFLVRALLGEPITIYGDGKQVRDVLFVSDLVDAMIWAISNPEACSGSAYNLGGGPQNTLSLLELLDAIAAFNGKRPTTTFAPFRTGDQRYYVSDTSRFSELSSWTPKVQVREGLVLLHRWLVTSGVVERAHGLRNAKEAACATR